jgi:hypothetical protein
VRIEIRQHRKSDAADLLGEGLVRENRIHADAQDLSVSRLELLAVGFEVGELLRSAPGEIERIERQHDVLLADIVL